ncbi:Eco29kI family restriction endonuclease [Caulobacter sp. UNC279MFTsu5.1]|uniref:Eco29kI family restriction endonuclease n=1 Tax=Caulobacter sp. UNC279MFTsu5.1 TaxID=1502775 RepID=UPI0008E1D889|nr:Eco29kI family restriction endonuclease [Caulobacter sp. UNC279MFTsu5.1]SFI52770.1 Eco29kI restriction endonuclease [Caulobacter sp. UNC279MFTsu5.1]
MSEPFDPLAVENIGVTLAVELLEQPTGRFPLTERFTGAGIYALYYHGELPGYAALTALDAGRKLYPVYIGSAVREKAKQGFTSRPSVERRVYGRLRSHQSSIGQAGLNPADFSYRYLILNDAYITLAESVLIAVFRPIWNGLGFGSNGVGGVRIDGKASLWDGLHAGRAGRPAADAVRQAEAAAHVADCIARIGTDYDDPRTQEMADRIMQIVNGLALLRSQAPRGQGAPG